MAEDDPLAMRLAGAIVDATRPDWAAAESTAANPDLQRVIRELRVLAALAAVHRDPSSTDSSAPEPPPVSLAKWGSLQIRGTIGQGHFGTVYRAWDEGLEREVALKLLRETARAGDIIHEGRLLARVRHPNVVAVYGVDRHEGHVGLWMEFVDGLTLARVLATRGALDTTEAALVGIDLCRAVAAVHKAGLVHRDIKAHNVMREGNGRIVLMDFGAGEIRTERSKLTPAAGTPLYLAPELFDGGPATIASDVYSMGVLLFHLVTKRYPVEGATLEHIAAAHARQERHQLRDLHPDVPISYRAIVDRALHRDPARRYRTCEEMQRDLMDAAAYDEPAQTRGGVPAHRHTENARAYEHYLRGRFYWTRRYHGGLVAAIEHFRKAIEEDAGYALAFAGLADAYAFIGIYAVQPPRAALAQAIDAAERALTLDPNLPDAYSSLAFIKLGNDWDLAGAARAFGRALELDPQLAVTRIYYSWLLVLQGDVASAMTQIRAAQDTEPLSPLVNAGAGHTLYLARRYDEAIAACEKGLEIDPNFILGTHVIGMCRALQGRLSDAVSLGQHAATMSGRAPFYLGVLGHYHARAGALARVQDILRELDELAATRYVPPHCRTFVYAGLNDLDSAFAWQAKAQEDGASPFYYVSPLIENLHDDPRHLQQMRAMGWPYDRVRMT